MKKICI